MKNQRPGIGNSPPVSRAVVMPVARALAGVLRRRRERLGLSLNQLARLSGVSRQMLGFVETDACVPTVDTLARIALALGSSGARLWAAAERWLARQPALCRACNYACMARGELKELDEGRQCTRSHPA